MIPTGNSELREKDIISIVAMPKAAAQFFKKIKVQTDQVRDAMDCRRQQDGLLSDRDPAAYGH